MWFCFTLGKLTFAEGCKVGSTIGEGLKKIQRDERANVTDTSLKWHYAPLRAKGQEQMDKIKGQDTEQKQKQHDQSRYTD